MDDPFLVEIHHGECSTGRPFRLFRAFRGSPSNLFRLPFIQPQHFLNDLVPAVRLLVNLELLDGAGPGPPLPP